MEVKWNFSWWKKQTIKKVDPIMTWWEVAWGLGFLEAPPPPLGSYQDPGQGSPAPSHSLLGSGAACWPGAQSGRGAGEAAPAPSSVTRPEDVAASLVPHPQPCLQVTTAPSSRLLSGGWGHSLSESGTANLSCAIPGHSGSVLPGGWRDPRRGGEARPSVPGLSSTAGFCVNILVPGGRVQTWRSDPAEIVVLEFRVAQSPTWVGRADSCWRRPAHCLLRLWRSPRALANAPAYSSLCLRLPTSRSLACPPLPLRRMTVAHPRESESVSLSQRCCLRYIHKVPSAA